MDAKQLTELFNKNAVYDEGVMTLETFVDVVSKLLADKSNVKQLGYYARSKTSDTLYQFRWLESNVLEIKNNNVWIEANPDSFEILEIGHFISE